MVCCASNCSSYGVSSKGLQQDTRNCGCLWRPIFLALSILYIVYIGIFQNEQILGITNGPGIEQIGIMRIVCCASNCSSYGVSSKGLQQNTCNYFRLWYPIFLALSIILEITNDQGMKCIGSTRMVCCTSNCSSYGVSSKGLQLNTFNYGHLQRPIFLALSIVILNEKYSG